MIREISARLCDDSGLPLARATWKRLLASCCAGLLLALCTVPAGVFLDDFVHLSALRSSAASPFGLFSFASGNPGETAAMIQRGPLPWFTLPELKVRFFRPLSSLGMWVDVRCFGQQFWAFHLHSVLWYAALLIAVALLFRKLFPPGAATLALLLFAVDEAHLMPVGWWSNRNAVVAAVPAVFGLVAHLRWRREGWKPGRWLSCGGIAVGLLGGEVALGMVGYIAAFELTRAGLSRTERARGVLPALALGLCYFTLYSLAGYGAHGTNAYLSPLDRPLAFAHDAPGNFLAMAAMQLLQAQREFVGPGTASVAGGTALLVLCLLLWRLLPREMPHQTRTVLWLGLGACFSAVPALGTLPSGRLMMLPSIGGAAVLAALIVCLWRGALVKRAVAVALLFLHVVLAAAFWPAAVWGVRWAEARAEKAAAAEVLCSVDPTETRVLFLTHPDPMLGLYSKMMYEQLYGCASPRCWWSLTLAPNALQLERVDDRTLDVRFIGRPVLVQGFESLLRSVNTPFQLHDRVPLDGLELEVTALKGIFPSAVRLRSDRPMDEPRYWFVTWEEGRYQRVALPAPGETVDLPAPRPLLEPGS